MTVMRCRGYVMQAVAVVLVAMFLATGTVPVDASPTESAATPATASAEGDLLDAAVDGALEGYVAGGVAGGLIGWLVGAAEGALVGAAAGAVAGVVMYMVGSDGDQYELTGLPKGRRLPKTVLD